MRHVMLLAQVLVFLLVSVYTLWVKRKAVDFASRYRMVGLFGLIMVAALSCQLFFPLLPIYSIGYMLGSSLLRTFVIESEKEAYQKSLQASLRREQQQRKELSSARELAYTDALTGVRSRLAYLEKESLIDQAISDGTAADISVAVFDLNGLKHINDTMGHDFGDRYILDACILIGEVFRNSPVFRIGGDEFAVILEGADYENREALMEKFHQQVEENRRMGHVVVSAGMAEYLPGTDFSFERVFKRADRQMYRRKEELKRRENVGV
jgi:diguanylate cyclase (GGDEF)-like protein